MKDNGPLLRTGDTCWRVGHARRAAFLVDNAAYFTAAKTALLKAQQSIQLLGWEFNPFTRLRPDCGSDDIDEIGAILEALAAERRELDIRVLIWNAALGVALGERMMPQRAALWFRATRVRFRLDGTVPIGASHHQKLMVIDDALAFCSGDDFTGNRWDQPDHLDQNPARRTPWGSRYPPRHGATLMVDGEAARALGDLARQRWRRATREAVEPVLPPLKSDLWPEDVPAALVDVDVGISRTMPRWKDEPEIRENEALFLASIAAARRTLYLENQYFASRRVGGALEKRLSEPKGPEIVVITGERAPSVFDQAAMDAPRDVLVRRLQAADRYGHFRVYAPHAPEGRAVLVHSKLMIVDDRLVRIGSSNVADRSLGYDSECDLAIERSGADQRVIAGLRHRLIAHFLGRSLDEVRRAEAAEGLIAAIEALDRPGRRRLHPLVPPRPRFPYSLVARYHLGDPSSAPEAWRPWRRKPSAA